MLFSLSLSGKLYIIYSIFVLFCNLFADSCTMNCSSFPPLVWVAEFARMMKKITSWNSEIWTLVRFDHLCVFADVCVCLCERN